MVQDHMPDTVLDVLGKVRKFEVFKSIEYVEKNLLSVILVWKNNKNKIQNGVLFHYVVIPYLLCVVFPEMWNHKSVLAFVPFNKLAI